MDIHRFELHPFRAEIAIIFSESVPDGLRYLRDECGAKLPFRIKNEKHTHALAVSVKNHDGLPSFAVIFNRVDVDPGRVAHESLHIIRMVMLNKGMDFSDDTEEYCAHALQELVNFILSKHNK